MAAFNNTVGAATLSDNQVYGPTATCSTAPTAQWEPPKATPGSTATRSRGLDYYVSRYYDPVAGVFLSADVKEGNAQGMNPYTYEAQNLEIVGS